MNPLSYKSPEFLEMVKLAVDGALRPDEQQAFFERINSCPNCLETYYKEKGYKHFMNTKLQNMRVSPDLISKIKLNLKPKN